MNILAIGDIVGETGVKKAIKELPKLKEQYNIDFCLINAENSAGGMGINKKIFEGDVECIKKSDLLIFDLNGRVPDEVGCVELGMAYAWGIKAIGFKTDTRALDFTGDDNLMIEGCMNFKIARSLEELENMLNEI